MKLLTKILSFSSLLWSGLVLAETQNTVSLSASQMLPGDSGSFTSTQVSGSAANAAGTLYHTYAGALRFDLSTATGRYAGLAGTSAYGINAGPFLLFRSFLTANFLTAVSSSTICPGATDYNWLGIRFRSPYPSASSTKQDASLTSFYAGGNLTYDPSALHPVTGNSMFDLAGPTLDSTVSYYFDGVSGATCSSGTVKMLAGGTDQPMDNRGAFFFGDSSFLFVAGSGNPVAAIGLPEQVLTGPGMAGLANSAFTGLYTSFGGTGQSSTQDRRNVIAFPDAAGTTFSLYTANDLNDPSNRTALGTVACTSLNTPDNGFCSGTLSLSGQGGTGKAVCLVSTTTPEWILMCTAQHPADTKIPITFVGRVPSKAILSVSVDASYYSVASIATDATITATVRNLSGKAVSTMGQPSSGALQLSTPFFLDASAFTGGGGGNCGTSLGGYQSCTFTITYNPAAVGTSFQTLRVAYNDGYYGTVNATTRLVGIAELSSINITPSTASFPAGSTVQYTATATYSNASTQDVTSAVTWSSDATSVATISSSGVANFSQTGSVNFTAALGATSDGQSVSSASGGSIEVLGQPTGDGLEGALTGFSGLTNMLVVSGRLFVADTTNNRVLIWDTLPTSSDAPADLVLGQPDLDSRTANPNGVLASSLSGPTGLASDGTRLVVADTANNRVLIWTSLPTQTEQDADLVLGQTGFTTASNDQGGISLATLDDPTGVAIVGTGALAKLIVTDRANHRALIWNTFPTSNKQAANIRLGQSANNGQTANAGGAAASNTLSTPRMVSTDGTRLFMVDAGNNRVLVWDTIPTSNQQAADRVLGQPDFTSTTAGTTDALFSSPYGVSVAGSNLYIGDNGNHRVLMYTALPTTNGEQADLVLGQSTFTTGTANQSGIGSSTLNGPSGVFESSSKLYVADTTNNRLLIWSTVPTSNKQASSVILGQPNATTNQANSAGLPDADNFRQPSAISACGTKLFVADPINHRVLGWNTIPTTNGQAADFVLGQPNFASNTANNGGRSASTMNSPQGVYCDGTNLLVADTSNHRVLIWTTIPSATQTAATRVLGQTLLTQGTANQSGIGLATLSSPRGVWSNGTMVIVADSGNNRLLIWNTFPAANKTASNVVVGYADGVTNAVIDPPTSSSLRTPYSVHSDGTRLFVADYNNNRVMKWNTIPSAHNTAANNVLGQSDFTTRATNQGGVGSTTLRTPTGVYADGTSLYIADYANHRVVIHDTYPTTDKEAADRVIGQANFTVVTANTGGIDATSLNNPRGLYSDGNRVFISDYNNYRVTVVSVKAKLSISNGPTYSYGDIVVGNTSIKAFTITNLGALTATSMQAGTALTAPYSFVGGSYPGTSGTCTNSLSGGATCTIRVQFNPTAEAATFTDVARVEYNDGANTTVAVVGLTGRSVLQSSLTFTDGASWNFGVVNVGSGSDKTLTLSNASGVLATLMKQGTPVLATNFAFKGGQYPGTGGTCGTVLATGNTCNVVVRFAPVSTGAKSQTFYMSYYNGSFTTTASINLQGTGN